MKDFTKAKGISTLKQVANKISNESMPMMLEISSLIENPDNEYLFGLDDIEHMSQGIKQNGFRGAIEVWDLGNGTYEIYSGHRRKRAMELLGETKIRGFVYPRPEEETVRRRLFLGANLYGRNSVDNSQPIYTARQMEYHHVTLKMEGFKGDIRSEVAREFGVSSSQVHKYMSLLNLSPELLEKVNNDVLPMTVAAEVGVMPEDKQKLVAETFDRYIEINKKDKVKRDDGLILVKAVKQMEDTSEAKPDDIVKSLDNDTISEKSEKMNSEQVFESHPEEEEKYEIDETLKEDKKDTVSEKEKNNIDIPDPEINLLNVKELAEDLLSKCQNRYDDIKRIIDKTPYAKRSSGDIKILEKTKLELKAFNLLMKEMEPVVISNKSQPELPLLKNNEMRQRFIEDYECWGVWKEIPETEERYYKYNFKNGSSIIVKVYFQKGYSWTEPHKDHWGSVEYYLIKNPGDHFRDCKTNMTALVEYLKDLQKK